jgi:RNA-directed DNA polymerase
MTAMAIPLTGAPSSLQTDWKSIDWKKAVAHVRMLQMRIAKAFREGKRGRVKSLQRILTNSFYAKVLAVKRVTTNKGAKTPGVDGITWNSSTKKMNAALSLKRRGYKTKPLKRIYIPKKQNGKLRPLSIPVMECRAQQALHLLTLEPISETIADKNSYGFRPLRSTADAIEQCFNALCQKTSAQYILEGDIRACFDNISHRWLEENTPMDSKILRQWLNAGYIDKGKLHATTVGAAQGGIISPTTLIVTLSGLEKAVKAATKRTDKVNVCIYADDFIITGATAEVLENKVKPAVEAFLSERGLTLHPEKTKITHIDEGFDFLGMNVRKYKGKLIIKPAKSNVKRFLATVRDITKRNKACKTENLIELLNPKIRGWSNYYKHVCSKKTFSYVDREIFKAIWSWAVRRHPNKGKRWVQSKYFRSSELRNWVFFAKTKDEHGKIVSVDLAEAKKVTIKRHIKIRADATPYDAAYHKYYDKLIALRKIVTGSTTVPSWWLCWWNLFSPKVRKSPGRQQRPYKGLSRVR